MVGIFDGTGVPEASLAYHEPTKRWLMIVLEAFVPKVMEDGWVVVSQLGME